MLFFHKKKMPVIVTIHGFGKRLHHEFDPFAEYFRAKNYEVVQFDIYNVDDPNDADVQQWIQRCEDTMHDVLKQHDEVILVGFSMGGVIASYLATIYPVKCLILSAPAFQYLDIQKIMEYGVKAVNKLRGNNKTKNEEKPSSKQVSAFQEVVSTYKESISQVSCPVLMIHGTKDEVIPLDSSRNAYEKINAKKSLIFFEKGKHRMLYDNTIQNQIFPILELMMEGKLL